MVWSSTTQVARVPAVSKDYLWDRVKKLTSVRKVSQKPVCCYALQGKCMYGDNGCRYSHDVSLVWEMGCQYGSGCNRKHPYVGSGGAGERQKTIKGMDQGVMSMAKAPNAPESDMTYLEATGQDYDDTDPLWDEIAYAFRDAPDDNGASDIPKSVRNSLTEAGQYRIVDEDMQDEWLCLPAEMLQSKLSASPNEADRRGLLSYELRDLHAAWEMDRWLVERKSRATDEMRRMDEALHQLFDSLGPPSNFNLSASVLSLLDAAAVAIEAHLEAARARMLAGESFVPVEDSWHGTSEGRAAEIPYDAPEGLKELLELHRCAQRCVMYARSWFEATKGNPDGGSGLVELVRRAAKSNEHVLVHHVVSWAGSDVD